MVQVLLKYISNMLDHISSNGLRYLRWGGRGLCLEAEKTRSVENLEKPPRIPGSNAPFVRRSSHIELGLVVEAVQITAIPSLNSDFSNANLELKI